MANIQNLLVELLVEELPPRALQTLSTAFAQSLVAGLHQHELLGADSSVTPYATPRRLAVHITDVASQAADKTVRDKLMPVRIGLDADGQPTAPLLKKLKTLGADATVVPQLVREGSGKKEMLLYEHVATGATLQQGLQQALERAISELPIPKVMSYQLHHGTPLPGWDSTHFVRPVHGLIALHGSTVVPVQALGLQAGRSTQGHRFEAQKNPLDIASADAYAGTLAEQGAVIASFDERRALIQQQLKNAAAGAGSGLHITPDTALLDEVTALVECPNTLVCEFEEAYLAVPPECLILTMKTNQRYFPLRDSQGKLSNRFLVVSNIRPKDPSAIIAGNQRVVRARLADAKFFYDQDRKQTLGSRVSALDQVIYHAKLGSQGGRMERVRAIAASIAAELGVDVAQVKQAARLAKTDLLTGMVGEFPELQGTMGRYYALHEGLPQAVADAIEDHYKPRFSGDELPRGPVGTVLALADKLETLLGLFGIGEHPTGDKDPFALRRHALGVIRILMAERKTPLGMRALLDQTQALKAMDQFNLDSSATPTVAANQAKLGGEQSFQDLAPDTVEQVHTFMRDRLGGYLREQGYSAQEVDAVLSACDKPAEMEARLEAVQMFNQLPEAEALAAANKRITNILKKSADTQSDVPVNEGLLKDPAEQALHTHMQEIVPQADQQFKECDYTASLKTLAQLRDPVDTFFADVMVNAEDPALRRNRLRLLHQLHQAMNRVADLSRLAA